MKENYSCQVEKILDENYKLFAIMGVFGALSVYLATLFKDVDTSLQIGIVASFGLFIIVSALICRNAFNALIDMSHGFSWRIIFENVFLSLFIFLFGTLVVQIALYIFDSFRAALIGLSILLSFGLGSIIWAIPFMTIEIYVKNRLFQIIISLSILAILTKLFMFIIFNKLPIIVCSILMIILGLGMVFSAAFLFSKIIELISVIWRKIAER